MKTRHDWVKIQREYVDSNISLRDLASKHSLVFSTVGKRAKREEWRRLRIESRAARLQKMASPPTDMPERNAPTEYVSVEKLHGHLRRISERLEIELEKVASSELTKANLEGICELGRILRSLAATLNDLQHSSPSGKLGQRRLIRPGVLAEGISRAMELAPCIAVPKLNPEPVTGR